MLHIKFAILYIKFYLIYFEDDTVVCDLNYLQNIHLRFILIHNISIRTYIEGHEIIIIMYVFKTFLCVRKLENIICYM